jgi:tRNA dimethylallyltransferase
MDECLSFLVGPTASGKSELALRLADTYALELFSLDSMQVYRGMDVGTAKPKPAEQARVRHHLIDLVEPSERYHAARYAADAGAAWSAARTRGARGIFCGGTGLYLKVLTHGLDAGEDVDPTLRASLNARAQAEGSAALHAELARVDPGWAARVHPNDKKRIVRGLEVFATTGQPLSGRQRAWPAPGRPRRIVGLSPKPERHEALLGERTRRMLAEGWVEEVERLLAGPGLGPTARAALGYAEIARCLAGELRRSELEPLIALRTRQFARRQRTWFRGFSEIDWIDPDEPDALQRAARGLGLG